jgi:hypothetical protein
MLQLIVRASRRPRAGGGQIRNMDVFAMTCYPLRLWSVELAPSKRKNELWPGLCKQFEAARYGRAEAVTGPEAEMRRRDPS